MKSYTDIEQSKRLASILLPESVDMVYLKREINDTFIETPIVKPEGGIPKSLPCWSLSAVLGVLPANYVDVNDTIYHPNLMKTKDGRYMVIYNVSQYTSLCNNPVDACVAMIEKLHELNLL